MPFKTEGTDQLQNKIIQSLTKLLDRYKLVTNQPALTSQDGSFAFTGGANTSVRELDSIDWPISYSDSPSPLVHRKRKSVKRRGVKKRRKSLKKQKKSRKRQKGGRKRVGSKRKVAKSRKPVKKGVKKLNRSAESWVKRK